MTRGRLFLLTLRVKRVRRAFANFYSHPLNPAHTAPLVLAISSPLERLATPLAHLYPSTIMFGTAGLVRDRREMQKREQQLHRAASPPPMKQFEPMLATSSKSLAESPPPSPQTERTLKFGSWSVHY